MVKPICVTTLMLASLPFVSSPSAVRLQHDSGYAAGSAVSAQAAAAPVLTLSIKGSSLYAKPASVPIQTALLIVTPAWEDVEAKTEVGGQEASGQLLLLSDLALVLGNRPMDCASIFTAPAPAANPDFIVVVGKAEAYLPAKGWQTTSIGRIFMAESGETTSAKLALDRFSMDVQSFSPKKKFSKDGIRASDGRLVLEQQAGAWRADLAYHSGDVVVEGQVPVSACPVTSRKKASGQPLLGERRLLDAARNF